jgi:hypothetical protein
MKRKRNQRLRFGDDCRRSAPKTKAGDFAVSWDFNPFGVDSFRVVTPKPTRRRR